MPLTLHETNVEDRNAQFIRVFRRRANEYFSDRELKRKANMAILVKIVFGISYWVTSYFVLLMFPLSPFNSA